MTNTMIAVLIIAYALCGFVAYGLAVYQFQTSWPPEWRVERLPKHRRFGILMALLGPFGLVSVLVDCMMNRRIGFKL